MFVDKVKGLFSDFLNRDDEYDEEEEFLDDSGYEEEEEEIDYRAQGRRNILKSRSNKLMSMPENQHPVQMKIVKPSSFEQAQEVCDLLKEKNSIVLNLEYVQKDVGRRFLDYIYGAVHFANGKVEKVTNSVFVIAPFNYEIANDTKEQKFETKMAASPWRN